MTTQQANLKSVALRPLTVRVSDDIVLTVFAGNDKHFYVSDETLYSIYEPTDDTLYSLYEPTDDGYPGIDEEDETTDRDLLEMFVAVAYSRFKFHLLGYGFEHPKKHISIDILTHVCETLGADRPKCKALMDALNSLTFSEEGIEAGLGEDDKLYALSMDALFPRLPNYITK